MEEINFSSIFVTHFNYSNVLSPGKDKNNYKREVLFFSRIKNNANEFFIHKQFTYKLK